MSVNKNNYVWQWTIPFVVLFCSWTFLGGWITIFARYWIWLIVGVISLVFIAPSFFSSKAFFALVVYSMVVLVNFFMGDEYYRSIEYVLVDITQFVFFGGVGYFLFHYKSKERIVKTILIVELFVITFTSVATYFADRQIPNVVRIIVGLIAQGLPVDSYYRMGVCKYDMPHALPILISPLILWTKQNNVKKGVKWLALIILLVIMLLVWTSAATTPLIVSIVAIAVSLVIKPAISFRNNIGRILVVLMLASPLFFPSVQLNIIHTLDRVIPEENNNKMKLQAFEERVIYGSEEGGDLKGREDLYQMSLDAFLRHPIIGTNKLDQIGEHSIFLDRLAALGIVGFIPFLLFFLFYFKDAYNFIQPSYRLYYIIGVVCFLLILALKNIPENWMHVAIFIMLPIMINYEIKDTRKRQ